MSAMFSVMRPSVRVLRSRGVKGRLFSAPEHFGRYGCDKAERVLASHVEGDVLVSRGCGFPGRGEQVELDAGGFGVEGLCPDRHHDLGVDSSLHDRGAGLHVADADGRLTLYIGIDECGRLRTGPAFEHGACRTVVDEDGDFIFSFRGVFGQVELRRGAAVLGVSDGFAIDAHRIGRRCAADVEQDLSLIHI